MNIEQALIRSGGTGCYQIFAFTILVVGMLSTGFILYNLNFLGLIPEKYECEFTGSTEYVSCNLTQVCDTENPPVDWRVNFTDIYSLDNWVE